MPITCHLRPRHAVGSSLVEVLVSLLLISISSLGLAALQINAKQLGHQASQRTQAVTLAGDLLERMRANRDVLPRYAVDGMGPASGAEIVIPLTDCRRVACSAVERSAWDLWEWQGSLKGSSAGGQGRGLARALACIVIKERRVVVAISWQGAVRQTPPEPGDDCDVVEDDSGTPRQTLRLASYIGEGPA